MRSLKGTTGIVITVVTVSACLFQLYTSGWGLLEPRLQRCVHLMFLLPLAFLLFPATKKSPQNKVTTLDIVLAILAVAVGVLIVLEHRRIEVRWEHVTPVFFREYSLGTVAILLVLEATRRAVTPILAILAAAFLLYLPLGPYMPGILGHSGFSYPRIVELLYLLSDEGIYGIVTGISATYVFLFVLFGAFMLRTGTGAFIIDLVTGLAGGARGGPAKIAVLSSGLFGTMTGVATANVYTTGSFTIPMMKKLGYRAQFAGAVEAAASTGGQYMPPIMGAAAFVMAEITRIPYIYIAMAAFPSAVLFYLAVGMMVHFEAVKVGLKPIPKKDRPSLKKTLRNSYLFLPIVVLLLFLFRGYSPLMAAFYAILLIIPISYLKKGSRMTPKRLIGTLELGAKNAVMIAMACTCAGMIVTVVTHTGLGLAFSSVALTLSGGIFFFVLIFVMMAAIMLGVGVPSTAAYILASTLGVPILVRLGADLLAAHLFTYYFAIIACCTPPVAVCAYAGAALAGSDPMKTGFESFKLAIAGFIVPFMFIYNPVLILKGSPMAILMALVTAAIGVIAIAAGIEGWLLTRAKILERILLIGAGIALVVPQISMSLLGGGIFAACIFAQKMREDRRKKRILT